MSRTTSIATSAEAEARGVIRRLVVVHGSVAGGQHTVVLDGTPVVLGREAGGATLVLDDARVSRRHASLAPGASGSWVLTDLGSRNGVHVDGVRRERAELVDGTVVRVGKSLLVYREEEATGLSAARPEEPPLFGPSLAMGRVRAELARAARTSLPVLVLGETGVGKELAASAIHALSGRQGPFVPVNCAAIPASMAEAELFGHEAGAFTGAAGRRDGLFAAAEGGTLFLDEVGELPLAVQPKLLRALAVGEIRPVGSTRPRRIDVRIVAATLRDLAAAEREGTFRGDLLARLSGFPVRLPALRERREDILSLAARRLRDRGGGRPPMPPASGDRPGEPALSPDAAEALLLHAFPHNVRELEHELDAALARWEGEGPLGLEHLSPALRERVALRDRAAEAAGRPPLPSEPLPSEPRASPAPAPRSQLEPRASARGPEPRASARGPRGRRPDREELQAALERAQGNVAQVAAHYGRDRHQVYRWLEHFGIDLGRFREGR